MRAQTFLQFIKLTRPLFLLGGMLLYSLGALLAVVEGSTLHPGRLLIGQALVTFIQLMTHYSNEYFDIECDRLNTRRTWFSGGSGVLVSGALSPSVARGASLVFALLAGIALLLAGLQVRIALLIGTVALAAAWSYSGPPLTLVRTGWGELFASLVVAGMVPLVGYAMQSGGEISPGIFIIAFPLVLIHFSMLVAFQIPDCEADALVGKRTICVRFGVKRAARIHNASLFLALCAILGLLIAGWPGAQLLWLSLPLAIWQITSFRGYVLGDSPHYLWLTMRALGLFALTTVLWLAGYVWIMIRG